MPHLHQNLNNIERSQMSYVWIPYKQHSNDVPPLPLTEGHMFNAYLLNTDCWFLTVYVPSFLTIVHLLVSHTAANVTLDNPVNNEYFHFATIWQSVRNVKTSTGQPQNCQIK